MTASKQNVPSDARASTSSAITTIGRSGVRGRPFKPGKSGNPNGRPRGSRNQTTLAVEALLDGEAEAITRKVIEKAKDGDMTALRLCLERIAPVRRDRGVQFDLPEIQSLPDALNASYAILSAVANGTITPAEAGDITKVLSEHLRLFVADDFEARLSALERREQP